MGVLELPGVHMHWADRWGLRSKPDKVEIGGPIVLEASEIPPIPDFELTTTGIYDAIVEPEPEPEPWFVFRCGVCDHEIPFYMEANVADLNPFNVTVIATQCEQCASRWAAVLSPVRIMEADKLNLQETDIINGRTD